MGYNFLIYGFPIYFILFEMIFRGVSGVDTTGFIGPTLAAAGLSFLLPLTKPKRFDVPSSIAEIIDGIEDVQIISKKDERLIGFILIFIVLGFAVWAWSCSVSLKSPQDKLWIIRKQVGIGSINYIMGVVFSLLKERV